MGHCRGCKSLCDHAAWMGAKSMLLLRKFLFMLLTYDGIEGILTTLIAKCIDNGSLLQSCTYML